MSLDELLLAAAKNSRRPRGSVPGCSKLRVIFDDCRVNRTSPVHGLRDVHVQQHAFRQAFSQNERRQAAGEFRRRREIDFLAAIRHRNRHGRHMIDRRLHRRAHGAGVIDVLADVAAAD